MQADIKELEIILNKEIETYSRLDECLQEKKDSLIKGDVERLRNVDIEIEKISSIAKAYNNKREKILLQYGNYRKLSEVIDQIQDKNESKVILNLKQKLAQVSQSVQKNNVTINALIHHSLNIVDASITMIMNTFIPESSAYNRLGKTKKRNNLERISSITQEA